MNEQIQLTGKWLEGSHTTFTESKDKNGKRVLTLETLIVPYGQVSRNGVRYNKESIEATHTKLVGKTLNHNHVTTGAEVLPRGKWKETWLSEEGMWGKAEIFDTKYNESYIEWLEADTEPRVSLQVSGSAKSIREKIDGQERYIREAYISDWLETSTVNLPGFDAAKGSMEVAICEAFNGEDIEESTDGDFFEKLAEIRQSFKEATK